MPDRDLRNAREQQEVKDKNHIAHLFEGWQETMIWSCLQGYMGKVYTDDEGKAESAQILIGDFCFFAGVPKKELVMHKSREYRSDFVIMVPENETWSSLIEAVYGENAKRRMRYATKKEPGVFDLPRLQKIIKQLPKPYEHRRIDAAIYQQIQSADWAGDLISQFRDYEDFKARGLGAVACKDGVVAAGASSYTIYREGIEIEIDTRKEDRRKGLALACGAKLILDCLEHKKYPSWDAQNKASVALAEKLGYHFDQEYPVYEIRGF